MSDKYVEKNFLYLLTLSLLCHLAAYLVIASLPQQQVPKPQEMTMVDLMDLPVPPPPVKPKPEAPKPRPIPKAAPKPVPKPVPLAQPKQHMLPPDVALPSAAKEAAPKAEHKTERIVEKSAPNVRDKAETKPQAARSPGKADSVFRSPEKGGSEAQRGEGLLKPHAGEKIELAKLFPSAKNMAALEESYRKKYRDAEQGDTRMIDTRDPLVAVYTKRLLDAANNSLDMESSKRALYERGAVGVLMVTVKRDGSIEEVSMLESTRSKALDDLVISSIYKAGYIGPVPKKWPHEKLRLIWIYIPVQPTVPLAR